MFFNSLIILSVFMAVALAISKLTNLKCEVLDPKYVNFTQCRLKVIGRGVISLDIDVELLQKPVSNISINVGCYKKANGYQPFLYNTTTNVCDFLKVKRRYPVMKIIFDVVQNYWNLNHTCPIDVCPPFNYNWCGAVSNAFLMLLEHDIIVRNFVLNDRMFKYMPVGEGEYMFAALIKMYRKPVADIKIYFQIRS